MRTLVRSWTGEGDEEEMTEEFARFSAEQTATVSDACQRSLDAMEARLEDSTATTCRAPTVWTGSPATDPRVRPRPRLGG